MSTRGVGLGTQLGFEKTDFVFVLNSEKAIKTFTKSGSITLGKNLSVALGPYGRSAEFSGLLSSKGMAGMFAYSKTRGVFGGKSWEGGIIGERQEANKKMYGITLTAEELLSGKVEPPPEAESLMRILNSNKFKLPSEDGRDDVSPVASTEQLFKSNYEEVTEQPVELPAETPAKMPVELPAELPVEFSGDLPKRSGELRLEDSSMFVETDAGPVTEVFELPAGEIHTPKPVETDVLQPLPLRIHKKGETNPRSQESSASGSSTLDERTFSLPSR